VIAGQSLERIVVTRDAAATRALGAALATVARPGDLISLVGELGAGKTQFAKGFGAGLGIADTIVSPSFVLMASIGAGCRSSTWTSTALRTAAEALAAASSTTGRRKASRSSNGRNGWRMRSRPNDWTS